MDQDLDKAASLLAGAGRVTAMTGAGVSAESGVPTFRGEGGLWKGRRPEEVATPEAFAADPEDVWEFYFWRRGMIAALEPNPGHYTLARWQERFDTFRLVTQNVDGLHGAAGSTGHLEIHGCLWRLRCIDCGREEERRDEPEGPIPLCPACRGTLRPAVVWFGEALDPAVLQESFRWAADCDVFLSIGTSSLVQPAASLPLLARDAGTPIIEINPDPTPLSPLADVCLRGPSGTVLPALEERLA